MALSGTDYREQMQALLPQGAAWPRNRGAVLTAVLGALAQEFARIDARARQLINEAIPSSTSEMLADWERVAGLPDNCSGLLAEGQQARRDDLVSKLISQGGQSREYFQSLAAAMGFTVRIDECRSFRAGMSAAGQALTNGPWRFTWKVAAPSTTVRKFRAGDSAAGERLGAWGNAGLECRIRQNKPAHTRVIFQYGSLSNRFLLTPDGRPLLSAPAVGILVEQ
ncbi:putative phage tail protein [Stenotrophomonas sp. PS02298]|uniref:YmfQ family protein n=1 Tax=Stenotrophomonas sp. PS02298 TaxID=2991424 RepID=UPI00249BC99E|nr:putative phage tail protein [Stenotrophomonas sp. PS02298]